MRGRPSMSLKTCEICGKRLARFICQECGCQVCGLCFELRTWVCSKCYNRLKPELPSTETVTWSTPFKLFLLGIILMFIGIVVIIVAALLYGTATISTGGLIWIIPLPPIILGAGPYALLAIMLAVCLTIVGIIIFTVWRKRA